MKVKVFIVILGISTYLCAGGFDDSIAIGEKVKIRHMAKTHKNGVVGDTLYIYEANRKVKIKDRAGALNVNTVRTDGKTLRKNRKLNVTHIQENTRIRRVSKNRVKNRRAKSNGVSIGEIDIRGTKIKNVKTYRRNNQYIIK